MLLEKQNSLQSIDSFAPKSPKVRRLRNRRIEDLTAISVNQIAASYEYIKQAEEQKELGFECDTIVDKGYAWIIVLAGFFSHMLQYGVVWTVGVFYVVFLENIEHNGSAQVALVASLNTAVYYGTGPLAGMLTNTYGPRKVAMAGGVLGSIGLFLSSFAKDIYHLYVTFGLMTGVGLGLTFVPTMTTVNLYFNKYQSIAVGLAASGVGAGTFTYPPLIQFLMNQYGWRGTLQICGGITLNLVVCAALLREIPKANIQPKAFFPKNKLDTLPQIKAILNFQIFKDIGYSMLCLNTLFVSFGLSTVYVHLSSYSESLDFSKYQSNLLITTIGASNLVGRIAFGLANQFPIVNAMDLYFLGWFCSGLATILITFAPYYCTLQIYAAIFGFFTSVFGTILPQVIVERVGVDKITNGYGYVLVFMAIGSLAGAPCAGMIYETYKIYDVSLYIGGGLLVLASFCMLVPRLVYKCCPQYDPDEIVEYVYEESIVDLVPTEIEIIS